MNEQMDDPYPRPRRNKCLPTSSLTDHLGRTDDVGRGLTGFIGPEVLAIPANSLGKSLCSRSSNIHLKGGEGAWIGYLLCEEVG